jgi:hypothetical protein
MGTLRSGGFVGVQAIEKEADFTTVALNVTGRTLVVSIDTEEAGSVAIGAVGVQGLGLANTTPLTATATDVVVEFTGGKDFSSLIGRMVAFEVKMSKATIFTLAFQDKPKERRRRKRQTATLAQ